MSSKAPFVDAMRSQPENLAVAQSTLVRDLDRATIAPWQPGETIAVVAMGASSHSGHALVAVLSAAGYRAVNLTASDLVGDPGRGAGGGAGAGFQPADHYVIVSESGRSPEPIEAARRLTPGRRIGISNFPDAQISEVIDVRLGLGGFDDSPVYTVGYTATLLAYALLVDRLGIVAADDHVAQIPALVASALTDYDEVAGVVGRILAGAAAIDVVGRGTSYATAAEVSLMIREGLRTPSAAFETYQYLHGPMEVQRDDTAVLIFGDGRELTVPDSVLDAGVKVVLVTAADIADVPSAGHPNLTIVTVDPALGGFVRPIIEVVIAQLALAHGIEHKPFPIEQFVYEQHDTKIAAV
ncbi:SIS domain-containing protein [Diaminobutyricibacter sp. McL0618]|uniref:SIS domain-containing protein n=1 Tax=Leifsonia sp. McL0618 TaxID=3415677 RepID=UPI003CEDD377